MENDNLNIDHKYQITNHINCMNNDINLQHIYSYQQLIGIYFYSIFLKKLLKYVLKVL